MAVIGSDFLCKASTEEKMLTRRDMVIALLAVCATVCVVVVHSQTPVMQSSVFDWNGIPAKPTDVGSLLQFFRSPTVTLDESPAYEVYNPLPN
jgi:hypothetical protein